jgi:hypothetical protein
MEGQSFITQSGTVHLCLCEMRMQVSNGEPLAILQGHMQVTYKYVYSILNKRQSTDPKRTAVIPHAATGCETAFRRQLWTSIQLLCPSAHISRLLLAITRTAAPDHQLLPVDARRSLGALRLHRRHAAPLVPLLQRRP